NEYAGRDAHCTSSPANSGAQPRPATSVDSHESLCTTTIEVSGRRLKRRVSQPPSGSRDCSTVTRERSDNRWHEAQTADPTLAQLSPSSRSPVRVAPSMRTGPATRFVPSSFIKTPLVASKLPHSPLRLYWETY